MWRTYLHVSLSAWLFLTALPCASAGTVIFVDDDAAGSNDGTSWTNAYRFLQDALGGAEAADIPVEIRVAQGQYWPDEGANRTLDDRRATFRLVNGVTIKGGYAGVAGPDPNVRDLRRYETVLTGDLVGNDLAIDWLTDPALGPPWDDNSYHVLTALSGIDETAMLDGFTITGGGATAIFTGHDSGGGLYCLDAQPTVANCVFTRNLACCGAAVYGSQSSPLLTNCTFVQNSAMFGAGLFAAASSQPKLRNCTFTQNSAWSGGGIYNVDGDAELERCSFSSNQAGAGGGMYNADSSPTLVDCTFSRNFAGEGGALYNINSDPVLTRGVFISNSASYDSDRPEGTGGAVCNIGTNWDGSSPTFERCVFVGNVAGDAAGAVFSESSTPMFSHCMFGGNGATYAAAMANCNASDVAVISCTFGPSQPSAADVTIANLATTVLTVTNSIIWDGSIDNHDGATLVVHYSDVKGALTAIDDPGGGLIWGQGNIDADPLFKDAYSGDFHLQSQAGRWDAIAQDWAYDDVTSPCIDAGDPNAPVADEPEPNGGRINMGAYGGTRDASRSPLDLPAHGGSPRR